MSDGPVKLAPADAPPLDDIILGEDEHTAPTPPVRVSASPPTTRDTDALAKAIEAGASDERISGRPPPRPDRTSNRIRAAEPLKDVAKKRAKMTLRIPDDEISRPQLPATTPLSGVPALGSNRSPSEPELAMAMAVHPDRIIAVGSPDDTLELPASDGEERGGRDGSARRAPGIDAAQEAGWTPYQPMVADRGDFGGARDGDSAVARAAFTRPAREPMRTMIDEPGMGAVALVRQHDPGPPASDDIPVDTDEEEISRESYDELATSPHLPAAHDSDDLKLDDGERVTDPGDVSELEAEDLVSVESIPTHHSPPPLKGGGKSVTPPPVVVTATALMSGVSAASASLNLGAPLAMAGPLAMPSALPAPSPVLISPPQPHAMPEPLPSPPAGTPMARRQQPAGGPFGFMPPVGALAPPPMSDSAANRKKTRPWWEDLFNDDFIRTMAKISDADIARESNFIEESLGCEAGATILDLACGTGRHAVELASRGYQVVGFDLSLSMLARASDEAQDRKQKINFVQGDMREMTFEETFDGIFSWNTSFGYFDEEKNAAVIAKVHRALKKGGQFLLDVVNRDNLIKQAPSLAWFEGDGCICMDEMQIDFITSRMKVKRTLMMDDGRTKEIEYSVRVYSLHELGKMLHDNGFRVAEVSGRTGTPGVFFGCESPRTLILAEKR